MTTAMTDAITARLASSEQRLEDQGRAVSELVSADNALRGRLEHVEQRLASTEKLCGALCAEVIPARCGPVEHPDNAILDEMMRKRLAGTTTRPIEARETPAPERCEHAKGYTFPYCPKPAPVGESEEDGVETLESKIHYGFAGEGRQNQQMLLYVQRLGALFDDGNPVRGNGYYDITKVIRAHDAEVREQAIEECAQMFERFGRESDNGCLGCQWDAEQAAEQCRRHRAIARKVQP